MPKSLKKCGWCKIPLKQRKGETDRAYAVRSSCGKACGLNLSKRTFRI